MFLIVMLACHCFGLPYRLTQIEISGTQIICHQPFSFHENNDSALIRRGCPGDPGNG